jgi:hypothetical protein
MASRADSQLLRQSLGHHVAHRRPRRARPDLSTDFLRCLRLLQATSKQLNIENFISRAKLFNMLQVVTCMPTACNYHSVKIYTL